MAAIAKSLPLLVPVVAFLLGMWYGHDTGYKKGYKDAWKVCTRKWIGKFEQADIPLSAADYVSEEDTDT